MGGDKKRQKGRKKNTRKRHLGTDKKGETQIKIEITDRNRKTGKKKKNGKTKEEKTA